MLQAGMFDARPRSREAIYVLLGQRAARALGDLRCTRTSSRSTGTAAFASANAPRGWLRSTPTPCAQGSTSICSSRPMARAIIGKIQVEGLLAARKRQLGERFTIKSFMDEFNAVG